MKFRHWVVANAGRVDVTLQIEGKQGTLDYDYKGMGPREVAYQLKFEHTEVSRGHGILLLESATGDLSFPHESVEEFEPARDIHFEYVQLREPAPFYTDDPGFYVVDSQETYDMVLYMGRFFSSYVTFDPNDEAWEEIRPYCEFARSLIELDKLKFCSVG